MLQFKISFDEQKFKNQYFNRKKTNSHVSIWDWSYYLITNFNTLEQHFGVYSLQYYKKQNYDNLIFFLSKNFGNFLFNETNYTFPNRYLIHLGNNYYLMYCCDTIGFSIHNVVCFILYLDNFILRYDEDYFDWRTLTPKKILGHIPINLPLSTIQTKFETMRNVINAQMLLRELTNSSL